MTHTRESIVFFSNRFGQNQIIKYGDGMKRTQVRRTLGTESTARDVEIKLCIIVPYFSALVRDTHLIYLPFLRQSCVSRIMGPAQVDSTVVIKGGWDRKCCWNGNRHQSSIDRTRLGG